MLCISKLPGIQNLFSISSEGFTMVCSISVLQSILQDKTAPGNPRLHYTLSCYGSATK